MWLCCLLAFHLKSPVQILTSLLHRGAWQLVRGSRGVTSISVWVLFLYACLWRISGSETCREKPSCWPRLRLHRCYHVLSDPTDLGCLCRPNVFLSLSLAPSLSPSLSHHMCVRKSSFGLRLCQKSKLLREGIWDSVHVHTCVYLCVARHWHHRCWLASAEIQVAH